MDRDNKDRNSLLNRKRHFLKYTFPHSNITNQEEGMIYSFWKNVLEGSSTPDHDIPRK